MNYRHRRSRNLVFAVCLIMALLTVPAFAQRDRSGFNPQGMREHHELGFPGTIADAVASFTRYYYLFDKQSKGEVPLATLLEAMSGGEAGEVRTLNRYKGWDKNGDGNISRAEMKTGIENAVNAMVEEQMKADADSDGALTPEEYLLSIPQTGRQGGNSTASPANQEKNANGLTDRQQTMFDNSDLDKDGKISRAEIIGSQARRASNAYLAMAVVAHAKACDVNGDGQLDLNEFGLLYGIKPGGKLPPQAESRFKGRDGSRTSINFQGLWQMLHHDPKAELDEMDRHITEFEKSRQPKAANLNDTIPAKPEDAATAFSEFFSIIDKDGDGKVTINEMFDTHNVEASDTKTLARFTSWDQNKDGFITRSEGEAGVKAYVLEEVDQQLKADSDGNGILSINEFALAVPDTHGEKLAGSNITKRQELMFRSGDTDKDNQYTRAEATASMSRRSQYSYIGRRVAYRARVYDLNHDRKYDLQEFALIYGAKPGESIAQTILDKHNSKSFGNGNHTYYNVMMRLIHAPQTELQEIDQRLTDYERRHSAAKE